MKRKNIKIVLGTLALSLMMLGCSESLLDETPRTIYEPGYFTTEKGIHSGITGLYAHTRWIFGQYFYAACENGTDEYTWAQSADNNFKDADMDGSGSMNPSSSRSDVVWNNTFNNINSASGIIEYAPIVGLSDAMTAEARFWRAWDYFLLVQTFGGVPLDLGSGELKFNTTPSRTSVRNTVPEVYTRGIFPDLKTAVQDLPATGRVTGALTKTAARFFLAKAYLTYAWWLENPNAIPTYPETPRTDPDGHNAAWYFQEAYNTALAAINDPGPFGLMDNFYSAHLGSNDRNKEMILYSDHIQDQIFNQASLSYSGGGAPDNFASWLATWNYPEFRSPSGGSSNQILAREAVQWGGRPWTRMAPTHEALKNTFADKINDSRFDGTFVTVYRGNWTKSTQTTVVGGVTVPVKDIPEVEVANGMKVPSGAPLLRFLDADDAGIVYPTNAGVNNVGFGSLPGVAEWVVGPSGINRFAYPGLWKIGTYRTDNGNGLGSPDGALTRPWNIAKFSELYLIAAEAAVKGATGAQSARDLVNVLRARAGKWVFSNADNAPKVEDNSAAMIAATPATIDINYILEERSRELFGEGHRWYDLVRTQTWADIAGTYTICGNTNTTSPNHYNNRFAHTPETFTRNIQKFHYLRPIPQSQFDRLVMSDAEKAAYQNPGYN